MAKRSVSTARSGWRPADAGVARVGRVTPFSRSPASVLAGSVVAFAIVLGGCATQPTGGRPAPVGPSAPGPGQQPPGPPAVPATKPAPAETAVFSIREPFDAARAGQLVSDGPNSITGRATLKRRDGTLATCSSQKVFLVPVTAYSTVRVRALYGSDQRGVMIGTSSIRFDPDPPEYSKLVRSTECDRDGNFRFQRVADGAFFVTAIVRWDSKGKREGGSLMQRVSVSGGRSLGVELRR
jgi:hypothetical protein